MIKRYFGMGLIVILFGVMAACSQNPSKVSRDTAQDFMNNLTYFRDMRTNLCFAVVASRRDFSTYQNGLTMTYVPCSPEVDKLIGK
jgi:hypothetical protein